MYNTNVKVSIIIPVYNAEIYLVQCIDSIITQTLKSIEIICIDDGSTDTSLAILRQYETKDSRIKVYTKPNSGYGHTINYGLRRSNGKYISIVESDDFIDEKGIESLYKCAEKNKADYVRSNYYKYSEKIDRLNESLDLYPYNKVISTSEEMRLFYDIEVSPWACLYRKNFLVENKIYMNETPGAAFQDNSWQFIVLLKAKRIVLLKEAFYHYRIDNTHSSINSPKKVFCILDEKNYIDKKLNEYHINSLEIFEAYARFIYFLYKWNYERISQEFQYAFLLEWKKEIENQRSKSYLNCELYDKRQWNEIQQIVDKTDEYFESTAKIYKTDNIYKSVINNKIYYDAFLNQILNNKLIIFGTGIVAKEIVHLMEEKEVLDNIICFCVTEVKEDIFSGKSVFSINALPYSKDILLVCATFENVQSDILRELKKLGFSNILSIDETLHRMVERL